MLCALLSSSGAAAVISPQKAGSTELVNENAKAVIFEGIKYHLRTHQDGKYVFTPSGQENLERWTDRITLTYDAKVTDGKSLAEKAIAWWQTNRSAAAHVLDINYVPRLDQMPARKDALYITRTILARPENDYDEFAFTTIRIVEGVGATARYSHREYRTGASSMERNTAWVRTNESLGERWFVWDGVTQYARVLMAGGPVSMAE